DRRGDPAPHRNPRWEDLQSARSETGWIDCGDSGDRSQARLRPQPRLGPMNLFNAIAVGFKEIWAHKFRSVLTMLGIILGVSSLVAMSALVKGMENGMREALIAVGGLEKVRVEQQDIPPAQHHLADQAVGLTVQDLYALRQSSSLVSQVA